MLWNLPSLRLTLLHQALVTESRRTWQPSPTFLSTHGLRPRRPQRRIECLKRCCRLRDVKRVTASCRNDVMIPYKSARPIGKGTTFSCSSATDRQPFHQPSLSKPCALPEPFRRLSLFPCRIKLCFSYYLSNSVGSTVHSASCRLVGTIPTAFSV